MDKRAEVLVEAGRHLKRRDNLTYYVGSSRRQIDAFFFSRH